MWTTLKLDLCCFCYWKWMHVLLRRKGKATITLILTSELKAVMWPVSRRKKKRISFQFSGWSCGQMQLFPHFAMTAGRLSVLVWGWTVWDRGAAGCREQQRSMNGSSSRQQNHGAGAGGQGVLCVCVPFQGSFLMGTCTLTSPQQGWRHSPLLDKERTGVVQRVTTVPSISSSSLSSIVLVITFIIFLDPFWDT